MMELNTQWYYFDWRAATDDNEDIYQIESNPIKANGQLFSREDLMRYASEYSSENQAQILEYDKLPYYFVDRHEKIADFAGFSCNMPMGIWTFSEKIYRLAVDNELLMNRYYEWIPIVVCRTKNIMHNISFAKEIFYIVRAPCKEKLRHNCMSEYDAGSAYKFAMFTLNTQDKAQFCQHWKIQEPPDVEIFSAGEKTYKHGYCVHVCNHVFKELVERSGITGFTFIPYQGT